jgi:HNH endonuclease
VHRLAFFLTYGREPSPVLRHACDNTDCLRPDHLLEGTQLQNIGDREARGRTARGEAISTKLTDEAVRQMRQRRQSGETTRALGAAFGIDSGQVSRICTRKRWSHVA